MFSPLRYLYNLGINVARKASEWTGNLTRFGQYLKDRKLDRVIVSEAIDKSTSYVSMLAHGTATPSFKLALRFAKWSAEKFGPEGAFTCEMWGE